MIPQPPSGQGPVDPRNSFGPTPPAMGMGAMPPMMMGGMSAPPPPPMMMMPPAMFGPPPKRGGLGRTLFILALVILLVVSVLVNLLLLGGSAVEESAVVKETLTKGTSQDAVAVIPLNGLIEENMFRQFDQFMGQAEKDKNIKAVVLEIDSPGGTVGASDEIYARILKYKQDRKIPVIVSMGSMATSGGYYAACAADHIFAQQTTLTGNIGVLMPRFNVHKLMEKWGVEENTIVSEGARYKNAGSMFSLETPEQTKYLQGIADSMFTRFKDVVKLGRSAQLKAAGKTIDEVADGRAFLAADAKTLGLIDNVGYLGDAIAHAKTAAGLNDPHVFRYHRRPSLMESLLARSSLDAPKALSGTTINGINVNVDRKLLDELLTPRVLYLWRGE